VIIEKDDLSTTLIKQAHILGPHGYCVFVDLRSLRSAMTARRLVPVQITERANPITGNKIPDNSVVPDTVSGGFVSGAKEFADSPTPIIVFKVEIISFTKIVGCVCPIRMKPSMVKPSDDSTIVHDSIDRSKASEGPRSVMDIDMVNPYLVTNGQGFVAQQDPETFIGTVYGHTAESKWRIPGRIGWSKGYQRLLRYNIIAWIWRPIIAGNDCLANAGPDQLDAFGYYEISVPYGSPWRDYDGIARVGCRYCSPHIGV
jgi:hypothetical protein